MLDFSDGNNHISSVYFVGGKVGISINEKNNRNLVEEYISTDPKGAAVLVEVTRKLRDGFYDQDYVDAIFQKGWKWGEYDIYDSYGFLAIHAGLTSGDILVAEIEVGAEPVEDKHVEEMNLLLKGVEKAGPFSATFWGEKADSDGTLTWTKTIAMERLSDHQFFLVKPHTAPLEVGSTKAWTTNTHLGGEHWVARWPYHSDSITLFFNAKKYEELGGRLSPTENPWSHKEKEWP